MTVDDLAKALRDAAPERTRRRLPRLTDLRRMIRGWEAGEHLPSEQYRLLLADVLGTSEPELLREREDQTLTRRDALALAGIAGAVLPYQRHAGPVAPELVDYFHEQLAGHYRADMMLGPRALIATVAAQSELIRHLLESADDGIRQRLAEIGTAYGAFLGWLHLDAGDLKAAARWHGVALELAHRSGNREAVACTLVDLAMTHTDEGSGHAVVDLCMRALADAEHLGPEVRVFALQQQAHGASLLADRRMVDQVLDEAGTLVDRVEYEEWGTACKRTANYVEIQRATCYGRLGLADEADRLWRQLIPPRPGRSLRDVGVWRARHATVRAQAGDPEHAVELAREAAGIAMTTGSARARRELAALNEAMRPWQDAPIGRDLAEVLAPVDQGA